MNHSIIRYVLFRVLEFEALFLLIPGIVGLAYRETSGYAFLVVALGCLIVGFLGKMKPPKSKVFYAKEGFVAVSLSWILISVVGALPFYISGEIPSYTDALFETISGFTTTGASVLLDVESLSYCMLFWRSFTHWIGGMGVLVLILAVLPLAGGYNMYLMRAEVPGPVVGKLVPRVKETARILYSIYIGITGIQIVCYLIAGMTLFDSLTLTFGTVGTGGFGILNDSFASYSTAVQIITIIFMILCGINFNVYYLLLAKKPKEALKCEEMRWYLIIIFVSATLIAFQIRGSFGTFTNSFKEALFQVSSIITTTGYSTTDYNTWSSFSKVILVMLMFIGACAGSTGGGLKVSRIIVLFRTVKKELSYIVHPRSIKAIRFENHALPKETLKSIKIYFVVYMFVFSTSVLLISLNNYDLVTCFTSVVATLNNIGPGLEMVGPKGNFAAFSGFSKYVLMFDMLVGRLELFPLLVLFSISTWRKNK